ncbi:MAG TPA: hypothetical protein VG268_14540 [Streptosporangiaceae bacterium]|jgi:hypothetical protein|nr:hypothetical protein [Streptosporangiaceae bacterium]
MEDCVGNSRHDGDIALVDNSYLERFYALGSLTSCNQVTASLVAKDLGIRLGEWTFEVQGDLTTGVTATTVPGGKTYVFVLGTDNRIWTRAGTWPVLGAWQRL